MYQRLCVWRGEPLCACVWREEEIHGRKLEGSCFRTRFKEERRLCWQSPQKRFVQESRGSIKDQDMIQNPRMITVATPAILRTFTTGLIATRATHNSSSGLD